MDFKQALAYLNSFINYEKKKDVVYDADHYNLESFMELTRRFGSPQSDVPCFHVTGTKGKGSVVEFIKDALMSMGYKTGSFTSPHIVNVRERIRMGEEWISEAEFAGIVERIAPETEGREKRYRTFFELITLMSFIYFKEKKADYAVYEVGMGGRLDSTNVVLPKACVINTVALDHTETLGDTLEKIAFEKAGIMKTGVPVVIGPQKEGITDFLVDRASTAGAMPFVFGRDFFVKDGHIMIAEKDLGPVSLKAAGRHQMNNCACAMAALHVSGMLKGGESAALEGMEKTEIKGRVEIFEKKGRVMVFDTGHTVESVEALFDVISERFGGKKVWSVTSFSSGKAIRGMLEVVKRSKAISIYTANSSFRAEDPEEMARIVKPFLVVKDPVEAVAHALEISDPGDIIVVHGSFYLLGDVYERFR